jgi:ribonuclease HII
MEPDLWTFERKAFGRGFSHIAGIDEAGRGPLAGPVVSAAVILPLSFVNSEVNDSKKLTPQKRDELYDTIYEHAVSIGIGIIDSAVIDRINILQASLLSMAIAAENLKPPPDYLLIDGNFRIASSLPQEPIIGGDGRSISVAAASIVAKVTRDRLMAQYHLDYPEFGFIHHKGYATELHRLAIRKHGCCLIHRRTFKGVRE